jgi:hypothetical protein
MAFVSVLLCLVTLGLALAEAAPLTVTDVNRRAVTVAAPVAYW